MNINKLNSINFNGYKNVVSHQIKEENGDKFSYMAMQLDNNGTKDLDEWKEIQKNLYHQENPDNVFILKTLLKDGYTDFFLGDYVLDPKKFNETSKEEEFMLRAFALASSLTKRIKNEYFPPEDKDLSLSLVALIKNFTTFFKNQKLAKELATLAALKRVKHHITAGTINDQIQRRMIQYFKL